MTRVAPSLLLAVERRLAAMWPLDKIVVELAGPFGGVHLAANAVRAVLMEGSDAAARLP